MSISFNTATNTDGNDVTSVNLTIPAGVLAGDAVFISAYAAPFSGATAPTSSLANASGGTTPNLLGSLQATGTHDLYQLWWFSASSADAGKALTFTITNSVGSYIGVVLGAWTGASATQPDVQFSGNGASQTTFAAPSGATDTSGDWALYFAACDANVTVTGNPGTSRQKDGTGGGRGSIADSNGSVGSAGTTIGGGTWTASNSGGPWVGFTVGLKPPGTSHTATASLTVTPTFSAARTRGKFRTGALTVTPAFSAARTRGKFRTGSLTVDPTFSAARTRGKFRTGALTVTPSFSDSQTHGHYRTGALTVTPAFSAARTRGKYRTAALTVIPSFSTTRVHGNGRHASLTVEPAFTADRVRGHYRTGTLTVAPSFSAVPSGGAAAHTVLFSIAYARQLWSVRAARN